MKQKSDLLIHTQKSASSTDFPLLQLDQQQEGLVTYLPAKVNGRLTLAIITFCFQV